MRDSTPKSKRPRNKLHYRHGYWEVYTCHHDFWFSGFYINGDKFGHHLRNCRGPFEETYNDYYAK